MSSACPDCTSRTPCVNHSAQMARRSVDSYVPKALRPQDWELIAQFTRALAHDLHPKDDRRAVEAMRTLSQVVSWAYREGLPLDRERIFTPDVIDRYIAVGAAHLSEPSRATRRADLRRFSRALTHKAPWEPEPPRMRGGYSIIPLDAVIAGFVLPASGQPHTMTMAGLWRTLQKLTPAQLESLASRSASPRSTNASAPAGALPCAWSHREPWSTTTTTCRSMRTPARSRPAPRTVRTSR